MEETHELAKWQAVRGLFSQKDKGERSVRAFPHSTEGPRKRLWVQEAGEPRPGHKVELLLCEEVKQ